MDNFKKFVVIFILLLHSCSGNPEKVESVIEEEDLDLQMFAAYSEGMKALEKGDVYFADFSIQILRPICFKNMNKGQPPIKWMGKKTFGLKVDYGFDIDEGWQIPVIKQWLREHGFTSKNTPYDL